MMNGFRQQQMNRQQQNRASEEDLGFDDNELIKMRLSETLTEGALDQVYYTGQLPDDAVLLVLKCMVNPGSTSTVCFVLDGGTHVSHLASQGKIFGMRCILQSPNATTAVQKGSLIKLLAHNSIKMGSGEMILRSNSVETVGFFSDVGSIPAASVIKYPPKEDGDELPPTPAPAARPAVVNRPMHDGNPYRQEVTNDYGQHGGRHGGSGTEDFNQGPQRGPPPNNPYARPPPGGGTARRPPVPAYQQQRYEEHGEDSNVPYGPSRRQPSNTIGGAQRAAPYSTVGGGGASGGRGYGRESGGGPSGVVRRGSMEVNKYVRINDLNAFLGRWTIMARVAVKGDVRTFNSAKGEGKLLNVDLIDKDDGEIRAVFFNKAVEKFCPLLEQGHVYTFSRGMIKAANRRFNSTRHAFELSFGEDAVIEPVDDDQSIPTRSFKPIPIADVEKLKKGDNCDVLGVLTQLGAITNITLRSTGESKEKREITIMDQSNTAIDVTLWGNKVSFLDEDTLADNPHPVIVVKGARVDDFMGRRLSTGGASIIEVEPPDIPEVNVMKQWFARSGRSVTPTKLSSTPAPSLDRRCTLQELQERAARSPEADLEDKGAWFTVTAALVNIDSDRRWCWIACPKCGKKMVPRMQEGGEGGAGFYGQENVEGGPYDCASCGESTDKPTRRYILNVELVDASGSLRCSAMGDRAQQMMGGISADDVYATGPERPFVAPSGLQMSQSDIFSSRKFHEYVFRIQAKMDTYMDERRIRYRVYGAEQVDTDAVMMQKEADARIRFVKERLAAAA